MTTTNETEGTPTEGAAPSNDQAEFEALLNYGRGLMTGKSSYDSKKEEPKEPDTPEITENDEDREDLPESTESTSTEVPPSEDESEGETEDEDEDEGEEKSEMDLLREQNKMLLKQLEEISGKIFQPVDKKDDDAPQAGQIELVTDEDFEELFSSKDNVNKVLNSTMQKTLSHVVRDLPKLISSEVMKTMQIQNTINQFYETNPDLVEHSQYLGHISTEIAQKEPQLTLMQNLSKTAEEFRKRTGLKGSKRAPKTTPSTKKIQQEVPQAPAGTSRTSVGTQAQKESMQDEIEKVLAFARGPFS